VAIISRQLGYLFIHAPRTGGTALAAALLSPRLQGAAIPRKKVPVATASGAVRTVRQHITGRQLVEADLITSEELERLFIFTTVRNPFDSLVSAYIKKRDTVPNKKWATNHPLTTARVLAAAASTFPEFIESQYGSRRPRHLHGTHIEGADFVMRFETLQHDFGVVLAHLGVPDTIEIPQVNRTDRQRGYRSYYTPSSRTVVETVFAPDLERFGYEF